MMTSALSDEQKTFCKVFHSPKSYILTFPHYLFGVVSQSNLRCYLLGYSPHFALNKTCNSHGVHLF